MTDGYIHGYAPLEGERLRAQARTIADLLHGDIHLPAGCAVLEAGCGVGAQTLELLRRNPGIVLTAVDRSPVSLAEAARTVGAAGLGHVTFLRADLASLPFPEASFDHVFVCFVLEHLRQPAEILARLARLLRPGGILTVIEGDHGATLIHPDSEAARAAIACQVELQRRAGGDPTIGRRLYPLLAAAGLDDVEVTPRIVSVDGRRPALAESFILATFAAMVAGVRDAALASGLATAERFDCGLAALRRTAAPDGTFHYTFFKGTGRRAADGTP